MKKTCRPGRRAAVVLAARIIAAVVVPALLGGCYSLGGAEGAAADEYYSDMSTGSAPALRQAAPPAEPSPMAAGTMASKAADAPASAAASPQDGKPADQQQKRLRVYSGYLELIVDEPAEARDQVLQIAEKAGGYVESTSAEYVVVRVPAEVFFAIFDDLAHLGDIQNRSIETADVTDQFMDLERRIVIARSTRERLYALLEDTKDVDERVKILREIRRLTEQIDGLESARDTMAAQIRMSRITVRLTPRIDEIADIRRGIPFRWIAMLEPLRITTGKGKEEFEITLPEDYAVLEDGERIRAESAEGTRFRLGVVSNEPKGDTAFWHRALSYHLSGLYRSAEPVEAGDFRGLLLTSKDIVPYQYLVVVRVKGDIVEVAETFFPDDEARTRRLDGILQTIGGMK